jgi:hypothetical protein
LTTALSTQSPLVRTALRVVGALSQRTLASNSRITTGMTRMVVELCQTVGAIWPI